MTSYTALTAMRFTAIARDVGYRWTPAHLAGAAHSEDRGPEIRDRLIAPLSHVLFANFARGEQRHERRWIS